MSIPLRKIGLLIFLVFLLSRLVLLICIISGGDPGVLVRDDERRYHAVAMCFMHNDCLVSRLHWDVPLYPFLLSKLFLVFPATYWTMIGFTIVMFSASVSVVYALGRLFLDTKGAVWAACLYGVYPTLWMISLYPGADVLFLLLFLIAVYQFIQYMRTRGIIFLISSAVGFALTTLTKEVAVFFPVVLVVILGFFFSARQKRLVQYGGVLVLTYILCLFPLATMNYQNTGRVTLSRKMERIIEMRRHRVWFSWGSAKKQLTEEMRNGGIFRPVEYIFRRRRFFCGTGTIGLMQAFGRNIDIIEQGTRNVKGFVAASMRYGLGWFLYHWGTITFIAVLYVSSFLAVIKLVMRKKWIVLFSLFAGTMYFLAVHFYVFNARHFVPFIPVMAILSVYCYSKVDNETA